MMHVNSSSIKLKTKKPQMSGQLLDTERPTSLGNDMAFEACDGVYCSIPSSVYLLEP